MIAAHIANSVPTTKRRKAVQPSDIFPPRIKAPAPPREMSVDESLSFIRMLNRSLGGVDMTVGAA